MKVISKGKKHLEQPKEITCKKCNSILEVSKSDRKYGPGTHCYCTCAVCFNKISLNNLWKD